MITKNYNLTDQINIKTHREELCTVHIYIWIRATKNATPYTIYWNTYSTDDLPSHLNSVTAYVN